MSTYISKYANGAAVDAALDKAEAALQPGDPLALTGGYTESGATLTQSGGSLTVPVDGKTYALTLSAVITNITTTLPTAPACSGCTVYMIQGATGYAVAYPAEWRWPYGVPVAVNTKPNSVTRLTLTTDPFGNVHADAEIRAVYA